MRYAWPKIEELFSIRNADDRYNPSRIKDLTIH